MNGGDVTRVVGHELRALRRIERVERDAQSDK